MKIGMSEFARPRHKPGMGLSYYDGPESKLIGLIHDNWDKRIVGSGNNITINDVCIVPLPPEDFVGNTIHISKVKELWCKVKSRRPGEEEFVSIFGDGDITQPKYAKVVLYSRKEILRDDESSGDFDWEIVSIMASEIPDEPMHPLTMARNQRDEVGGSYRMYDSPEEWARAVWYWSQHVICLPRSD